MSTRPVKVLIVDDSAIARQAIASALAEDPGLSVVGFAADPYEARERILALEPDVLTLDLEMPRMDGLTFLKILQEHHPLPVVIVSAFTPKGSELALAALEAGAVEVIQKPTSAHAASSVSRRIAATVRAAAGAHRRAPVQGPRLASSAVAEAASRLIVIGASTGGVEALRSFLPRLPAGLPPIVVVQHIPAGFSRSMAGHLDELTAFRTREAESGDVLKSGECLVVPGDLHGLVERRGTGYVLRTAATPPVNYCRPSVDVLFRSAAECAGARAVGIVLTGMGSDGARGLAMLRRVGARTLVQDEESSVVFGMPKAAIEIGAAEKVVSLDAMPAALLDALARPVGA